MDIDSEEIAHFLSEVEILRNLEPDIIREIAQHTQVAHFSKNQMLVEHGTAGKRLFFIFEGMLEAQIPDVHGDIRKRVILKKGEVAGEISLLIQSTYSANIVALSNTITIYLDSSHFMPLIARYPEFAEVMYNLMTNRMAQNGGINQVGKYQLLGKLGEGNMATVFRAYDRVLNREVALKMLKYKLACNSKFLDRFEQEAKTIASFNHPNIVNVIEIIDEFSTRFIVMEKLHGQNIAEILKHKGAFGIRETREILLQVANALEYAHNHGKVGIVHRDIKPSNIVIDHYGNIKLTDFGIAGPPQEKDLNTEGTPSYLAPEVINGSAIDGRADIYSLGVMAFQMLTNTLPFIGTSMKQLFHAHMDESPPDIRFSCLEIDEDLATFIERSLSKNPADRISDWDQIRKVLKPLADKKSILLDPNELAVLIKFRETSYQEYSGFIETVQKILERESIDHKIEMHRGNEE